MATKAAKKSNNLLEGNLLVKIILFSLPLIATGMLQMLFNAADTIVVGRWGGDTPEACENALAAVGSCAALITLIVNFFMGLSVGSSVCAAQSIGAGQPLRVRRVVHTSFLSALFCGLAISVIGILFAKPLLSLMGTDAAVIDQATLYMRAYFLGAPASMVYNFSAAILRSDGDTKNPLIFLSIAGVANVVLNLIMVLGFHLGAVGVGIATAASQWISCILIIIHMMRLDNYCRLELRRLRIDKQTLLQMIYIGLPAGIQSVVFSFSNVLIQSAINSFGKVVVASYTAATNICNFIFVAQDSFYHAAITFVGQNMGAKRYDRIKTTLLCCAGCATVVGLLMGVPASIFSKPLLGIYLPEGAGGLQYGAIYIYCVATLYFLCGVMNVGTGLLRGLGKSILSMLISIGGVCVLRVAWIYTIFAYFAPRLSTDGALFVLFLSYPVTWTVTALANYIIGFLLMKRLKG